MINCERVQVALSARLDGEPYRESDDVLDAHVSMCEQCQGFLDNAARLKRLMAFTTVAPVTTDGDAKKNDQQPPSADPHQSTTAAEVDTPADVTDLSARRGRSLDELLSSLSLDEAPQSSTPHNQPAKNPAPLEVGVPAIGEAPDLSSAIMAGIDSVQRARHTRRLLSLIACRSGLVVLGIICAVWAIMILSTSVTVLDHLVPVDPAMQTPTTGGEVEASLLVDTAALRLALAMGLFFAAWKPRFAPGVLFIVGPFTAFSLGFTTRDVVLGFAGEKDIIGLVILVIMSAFLVWAWVLTHGGAAQLSRLWRTATARPDF